MKKKRFNSTLHSSLKNWRRQQGDQYDKLYELYLISYLRAMRLIWNSNRNDTKNGITNQVPRINQIFMKFQIHFYEIPNSLDLTC
jgi:hypothetical protein